MTQTRLGVAVDAIVVFDKGRIEGQESVVLGLFQLEEQFVVLLLAEVGRLPAQELAVVFPDELVEQLCVPVVQDQVLIPEKRQ